MVALSKRKDLTFVKGKGYVSKSKLTSSDKKKIDKSMSISSKPTYTVTDTATGKTLYTAPVGAGIGDVKLVSRAVTVKNTITPQTVSLAQAKSGSASEKAAQEVANKLRQPQQITSSVPNQLFSGTSSSQFVGPQQQPSTYSKLGQLKGFTGLGASSLMNEPLSLASQRSYFQTQISPSGTKKEFLTTTAKESSETFGKYSGGQLQYTESKEKRQGVLVSPGERSQTLISKSYGLELSPFEKQRQEQLTSSILKTSQTPQSTNIAQKLRGQSLTDEAQIKAQTDFQNTVLAQQALNRKIEAYNTKSELQKSDKERNQLQKEAESINTRFRINPLVTPTESGYTFESSFTKPIKVSETKVEFGEEQVGGRNKYSTAFSAGYTSPELTQYKGNENIGEKIALGTGRLAGAFEKGTSGLIGTGGLGEEGAQKKLQKIGFNQEQSKIITEGTQFIAGTVIGGKVVGGGAKLAAGKLTSKGIGSSKIVDIANKAEKLITNPRVEMTLGGLAAGSIIGGTKEKIKESGNITTGLIYGAVETGKIGAEVKAFSDVVKGVKSGLESPLRTKVSSLKKGEGIEVSLGKGSVSQIQRSTQPGIVESVGEISGIAKTPSGREVSFDVYSGGTGTKVGESFRQVGRVQTSIQGQKPTQFTTLSEQIKLPSGRTTTTTDIQKIVKLKPVGEPLKSVSVTEQIPTGSQTLGVSGTGRNVNQLTAIKSTEFPTRTLEIPGQGTITGRSAELTQISLKGKEVPKLLESTTSEPLPEVKVISEPIVKSTSTKVSEPTITEIPTAQPKPVETVSTKPTTIQETVVKQETLPSTAESELQSALRKVQQQVGVVEARPIEQNLKRISKIELKPIRLSGGAIGGLQTTSQTQTTSQKTQQTAQLKESSINLQVQGLEQIQSQEQEQIPIQDVEQSQEQKTTTKEVLEPIIQQAETVTTPTGEIVPILPPGIGGVFGGPNIGGGGGIYQPLRGIGIKVNPIQEVFKRVSRFAGR